MNIVVIGAGIIGASIAHSLQEGDAQVTVIDGGDEPGGIASRNSFGRVNATYGNTDNLFYLRLMAMERWREHLKSSADFSYRDCGTLYVHFDRVDLEVFHAEHSMMGYALDWVEGANISALEPNLMNAPERCLLAPKEGAVDPEQAAITFAKRAVENGAEICTQETVQELMVENCRVARVKTDKRELAADYFVLAAGTATQQLAETAGVRIPMTSPPGLLVHTKPCPPLINHTIIASGLHIQQRPDGCFLAGADFGGGDGESDPEGECVKIIARIKEQIRGAENVELDHFSVGHRPIPEDGMPVVGTPKTIENLYIATMHSGATLAPAIGNLARYEILEGESSDTLEDFRPDRFLS